jgi:hypothetical protein
MLEYFQRVSKLHFGYRRLREELSTALPALPRTTVDVETPAESLSQLILDTAKSLAAEKMKQAELCAAEAMAQMASSGPSREETKPAARINARDRIRREAYNSTIGVAKRHRFHHGSADQEELARDKQADIDQVSGRQIRAVATQVMPATLKKLKNSLKQHSKKPC